MINYQPAPSLTWKYHQSTGQLDVSAFIYVNILAGELLTYFVSIVPGNKILITINIGSTGLPSPLDFDIPVTTIESNLTKAQVRDRIRTTGIQFSVVTSIYKNGNLVGESINGTSSSAEIIMA